MVAVFAILIVSTRIVKLWHGLSLLAIFVVYLGTLFWLPHVFGGAGQYEDPLENVSLRMGSSFVILGLAVLLVALNWRRVVYVFKGVPHPDGDEE